MRIERAEFGQDYGNYRFGYTEHAALEDGEPLEDAYEAGFLPASSDPSVTDRFYMARSVRVPLASWTPSSENRRILKKFDGEFVSHIRTREELLSSAAFKSCFLGYFSGKHGERVMSPERLDGILATHLPLRGVEYEKDGALIAYALEIETPTFIHYWYSAYDLSYNDRSLGMWLLLDSVRRAKDAGCAYSYLGTAYGTKGRYKMNLSPLPFWDGSSWVQNDALLKERIQNDS